MGSKSSVSCMALIGLVVLQSTNSILAQVPEEITNSIGMKLVLIPKGTFTMGSPPDEEGSTDDETQHEVTFGSDYYLGVYEVTQAQYQKVMGKNPSYFGNDKVIERHPKTGRVVKEGDSSNHPVETVSWEEAVTFCKRLSELPAEKSAGRVYRLPTEAEWEYACRADSETAYSFGENSESLSNYAWWSGNSQKRTHAVGLKQPNAWGLYDMHGNVWEWCSDWYAHHSKDAVIDPRGPENGSTRVYRGGSWNRPAELCRSAARSKIDPSSRSNNFGFRVAMDVKEIAE
jgi:formylglycine-generating enzyme required for sulfatase activity